MPEMSFGIRALGLGSASEESVKGWITTRGIGPVYFKMLPPVSFARLNRTGFRGMPLSYEVRSLYRFGVFELEAQTGELRRHGIKLKLQDQPYQVLLKLLEHAGQTVTRDQLRSTLWPADTFVDFETGLNTTIKRLRETLGDSADNPAFIETVPKRGYRFIAPVSTPDAGPDLVPNKPNPARGVRLNPVLQFGAVLILVLLLVGFALRHWSTATSLPTRVLDFAQLTSDGQAKQGRLLSDGSRIYFSEVLPVGRILAQVSAKGGETTTIPTSVLDPRPVDLSPEGTELLILSGENSMKEEPHAGTLWILPVAGGSGRPVDNVFATDALWGEKAETILYSNGHDLYVVNRDGSNRRKFLTDFRLRRVAALVTKQTTLAIHDDHWSDGRHKLHLGSIRGWHWPPRSGSGIAPFCRLLRRLDGGQRRFLVPMDSHGQDRSLGAARQSQRTPSDANPSDGRANELFRAHCQPRAKSSLRGWQHSPGRASQIRCRDSRAGAVSFGNLRGGRGSVPRWAVVGLYPFSGRDVMAQQHVRKRARTAHFSTNARLPSAMVAGWKADRVYRYGHRRSLDNLCDSRSGGRCPADDSRK